MVAGYVGEVGGATSMSGLTGRRVVTVHGAKTSPCTFDTMRRGFGVARLSPVMGRLRGWFGQDVARANAAQASVRLKHQSRQRQDLDAFLSQHPDPPARDPSGAVRSSGDRQRHRP